MSIRLRLTKYYPILFFAGGTALFGSVYPFPGSHMNTKDQAAGSGIGQAVAISLAKLGVKALGLVNLSVIPRKHHRRSIPEADLRPDSQ